MDNVVITRILALACLLGAIVVPAYLIFGNRAFWRSVFWCWFLVFASIVLIVYENVLVGAPVYWRGYSTEMYIRLIGTVATLGNIICPLYCAFLVLLNNAFKWGSSRDKKVVDQDGSDRAPLL